MAGKSHGSTSSVSKDKPDLSVALRKAHGAAILADLCAAPEYFDSRPRRIPDQEWDEALTWMREIAFEALYGALKEARAAADALDRRQPQAVAS